MANENQSLPPDMNYNRRSSVTSAALSNLFRSNSLSASSATTPVFPGPITSAAMDPNRRRRLSISTTSALGLSGGLPVSAGAAVGATGSSSTAASSSSAPGPAAFGMRRASMSTVSSSLSDQAVLDENAIDEDDVATGPPRASPASPYARRFSFGAQAMRGLRGSGGANSPGATSGRPRSSMLFSTSAVKHHVPLPPLTDHGYDWSEQLRSRAESTVSRGSFSFGSGMGNSPPRSGFAAVSGFGGGVSASAGGGVGTGGGVGPAKHDRAKSVSDVPAPQVKPSQPKQRRPSRPKPDAFQERILKGDFYMD